MPDRTVKGGVTSRLGRIEGELRVGRNATIEAEEGSKVVVAKGAYFEGPVTIRCDFECQSMRVEGRGFGLRGDVLVKGSLKVADTADISASVAVDGAVEAGELDVAGHLKCGPIVSRRVRVGGHLDAAGTVETRSLDVGGHATVDGDVGLVDFRVGGHAQIGGGTITGAAEVKGHLWAARKLRYGVLRVYGHTRLPTGSSGDRLDGFGKVEWEGDSACKVVKIAGTARAAGNLDTGDIEVKGNLEVRGGLRATERLLVGGTSVVKGQVECAVLDLQGRLVARKVVVEGDARLAGDLKTRGGLWAESVFVEGGTKCAGILVGESVEVGGSRLVLLNRSAKLAGQQIVVRGAGRMTLVGDIYGTRVAVGSNAKCGRVFARSVDLGEGCEVGKVVYEEELRTSEGVRFHSPPVKVAKLPGPPG